MYFANLLVSTWTASSMNRTPQNRNVIDVFVNVLGKIGIVNAPYFIDPERPAIISPHNTAPHVCDRRHRLLGPQVVARTPQQ